MEGDEEQESEDVDVEGGEDAGKGGTTTHSNRLHHRLL